MADYRHVRPALTTRVFAGVSWLAVAMVMQRLSGLAVNVVLARLLSPSEFGLVALAGVMIGFLAVFTDAGLATALVQRSDISDRHVNASFWMNSSVGLALAATGIVAARPIAHFYHEPRVACVIMALAATLVLSSLGQVPNALLQRRIAFGRIAIVECVSVIVAGVAGVVAALKGAGTWALVIQYVTASILTTAGRFTAARWIPRMSLDVAALHELGAFSRGAVGNSFLSFAIRSVDNALVARFLGMQALGFYSVAYNLVLMPGQSLGGMVTRVTFPAFASIQGDLVRLRGAYTRTVGAVALVTVPCVVGLAAVAPVFVRIVYGPRWLPAAPVIQILAVLGVLEALNTFGVLFYAVGRPTIMLRWSAAVFPLLATSLALGTRWGVQGVAWAYVAISPMTLIAPHLIANRLIALPVGVFVRAVAPAVIASCLMAGVIVIIRHSALLNAVPSLTELLALATVGAVTYGGLLVASLRELVRRPRCMPPEPAAAA